MQKYRSEGLSISYVTSNGELDDRFHGRRSRGFAKDDATEKWGADALLHLYKVTFFEHNTYLLRGPVDQPAKIHDGD